jgi:hypothetical protein
VRGPLRRVLRVHWEGVAEGLLLQMRRLPPECMRLVRAFATGWPPTPSAAALQAAWAQSPWVLPMIQLVPGAAASIHAQAGEIGLEDCLTCSHCVMYQLHLLRCWYDDGPL